MFERNDSMRRLFGFLFLTVTMALGCGGGGGGGDSSGGGQTAIADWTFMAYIGGDNNLSEAAIGDLKEMSTVGSTNNVKVVVQVEFSQRYSGSGVPADTRRMLIQKGVLDVSASTSIGNVNMADPATLTAFINWVKQTYPAKHYALVIWDHGAGWKASSLETGGTIFRGAVQDLTSGSFMSLPDLAKGVRDSGVHFDVIDFDACLMAMYEVAYEFQGLTDYMVFSEETEPGDGNPYNTILTALTADPAMSGKTLASMIVDKYNAFYSANSRGATTLSAVDMSQISALDAKILELATALKSDTVANTLFQTARTATQQYTYKANHDLYDLCSYVSTRLSSGTVKTKCGEIMTIVNSMVINNKISDVSPSQVGASHGLAIYVPKSDETNATDLGKYAVLACNNTRAAGSGTWGSYVEYLLSGAGTVTYAKGDFAIYLYWEKPDSSACDADIDLYVWEPAADYQTSGKGQWYAPYMGQTTPNGFFSRDSADSGKSEEYYLANKQVFWGNYGFVANFYKNGTGCSTAKAHFLLWDPTGMSWNEMTSANMGMNLLYPSPRVMSLDNTYVSGCGTLLCLNGYTNWWVPDVYWMARNIDQGPVIMMGDLPAMPDDKRGQMFFDYRKDMPLNPFSE